MSDQSSPVVSVVVPAKDEAGNVRELAAEICAALADGPPFEVIFVDDGSTDGTHEAIVAACAAHPAVRVLSHATCFGQSAAIHSGVHAAAADLIVTLDGDGQNDPADIPELLRRFQQEQIEMPGDVMLTGWRTDRADDVSKRWTAAIANAVRRALLGDETPDTGCGLKVFPRSLYMLFPAFDHMHRFLPALARRAGARTLAVPVRHRPRTSGHSKYGVVGRMFAGIIDLLGVMWLNRRTLDATLRNEGNTA